MITIRERLRPFSHHPSTCCLIPQTGYVVQAFPSLVRIKDLEGNLIKEKKLQIKGPLKEFTLFQDLERGCVLIWSEQYKLSVSSDLEIAEKKNSECLPLLPNERISFGVHKKQEWESIKKRLDFREIFPLWFRLGSLLNLPPFPGFKGGMFSLLEDIREVIAKHRPERVIPAFKKLFLAGFSDLMVPRLIDTDHQGILEDDQDAVSLSPLYLLQEGAALIRSLFIKAVDNEIALLPNLPPDCFCGRLMHMRVSPFGEIDLEWTKKTVRTVLFKANQDGTIYFHFHGHLKTYRLRTSQKEKGLEMGCGEPLEIKSGNLYLLDQFKK